MDKLNCLLVQADLFWSDAQANREKLESILRSQSKAFDVSIFPETFTSGFMGDTKDNLENMDSPTLKWMKALAGELGSVLCGSVAIASAVGTVNRFLWVQPDGVVHYYDKHHLFGYGGETERYVAGDERKIIQYKGWRICLQVCYDLRFPVWCRNKGDYDVMIFVANWPEPRTPAWTALLMARAIENQSYVIGVNRSGEDPRGLSYAGASAVFDPLGDIVLDLGDKDAVGFCVIDLECVTDIRRKLPFLMDADTFELG